MPRAAPVTTAPLPACVLYIVQPLRPRPSDTGDLAVQLCKMGFAAPHCKPEFRNIAFQLPEHQRQSLYTLDIVGTLGLCVGPSPLETALPPRPVRRECRDRQIVIPIFPK